VLRLLGILRVIRYRTDRAQGGPVAVGTVVTRLTQARSRIKVSCGLR
jgi:hypothetical protein